jgi:hypothetical protein
LPPVWLGRGVGGTREHETLLTLFVLDIHELRSWLLLHGARLVVLTKEIAAYFLVSDVVVGIQEIEEGHRLC